MLLVTGLLDGQAYPAVDLLATYVLRRQIENVFQPVTEVFGLRHLVGSAANATVFQASLCRVIYNALQVVRASAAAGRPQPLPVAAVSTDKLFQDMQEELMGLHRVLPAEQVLSCPEGREAAEAVGTRLRELLGKAWTERWKKAVNKKRRPHQAKVKQSGAHTSVHKVLQQTKAQPKPKANARRRE